MLYESKSYASPLKALDLQPDKTGVHESTICPQDSIYEKQVCLENEAEQTNKKK